MNARQAHALRKKVEHRCGRISDSVWKYALDKRMVSEVLQGESDLDWLVKEISAIQQLTTVQPGDGYVELSRRERRAKRIPSRQDAISFFVAEQARRDARIQSFRKTFLNSQILSLSEVEAWIQQRYAENPYRHAIVLRLPPGTAIQAARDDHGILVPPLERVERFENIAPVKFLEYHRDGSPWVQRIPAARDGPLGALREISESLADAYGWQKAQATTFVLTDLTPEIRGSRVWIEDAEFGAAVRIHLAVDPYLAPTEVAKLYQSFRTKFGPRKTKWLSEKHTTLALHALCHPNLDSDCLASWNRRYRRWAYVKLNRFKKEAQIAVRRLAALVSSSVCVGWKFDDFG